MAIIDKLTIEEKKIVFSCQNADGTLATDVEELCRRLGLTLIKHDTLSSPVNHDGWLSFDSKENKYSINIRIHPNKARQNFTIAHEIAHYLLHRDKLRQRAEELKLQKMDNFEVIVARSGIASLFEREANRLAAEILMPEDEVYGQYKEITKKEGFTNFELLCCILSETFRVSKQVIGIRLMALGLA